MTDSDYKAACIDAQTCFPIIAEHLRKGLSEIAFEVNLEAYKSMQIKFKYLQEIEQAIKDAIFDKTQINTLGGVE